MYEPISRRFRKLINQDSVVAKDILETLKLPSKGVVSHTLNISLGMSEEKVRNKLNKYILREHKDPLKGIKLVLATNSWPEIYRYVFKENTLASVIIEIGIDSRNFHNVYFKVENKIIETFAYSIEGHKPEETNYPFFFWEYSKRFCCFQVLSDKIININPTLLDFQYFGHEIDGTFVRKQKKTFMILPTLAVIFSQDKPMRLLSISYLELDIAKRNEFSSLLNQPANFDR